MPAASRAGKPSCRRASLVCHLKRRGSFLPLRATDRMGSSAATLADRFLRTCLPSVARKFAYDWSIWARRRLRRPLHRLIFSRAYSTTAHLPRRWRHPYGVASFCRRVYPICWRRNTTCCLWTRPESNRSQRKRGQITHVHPHLRNWMTTQARPALIYKQALAPALAIHHRRISTNCSRSAESEPRLYLRPSLTSGPLLGLRST
jgi:hypothetical protein